MNESVVSRTQLVRKANLFCHITLASLFALCGLLLVWHLLVLPVSTKPWFIALLHVLPLLAFAPGIIFRKPRVYVWLCFFVLLYFCQGVINAFALPSTNGVLGLLETLLTVDVFVAAMLAARYLKQAQQAD